MSRKERTLIERYKKLQSLMTKKKMMNQVEEANVVVGVSRSLRFEDKGRMRRQGSGNVAMHPGALNGEENDDDRFNNSNR